MGEGASKLVPAVDGGDRINGGFYMMCRQHVNSSIYVYGLHVSHPVLQTIEESIKSVLKDVKVSTKPEKHGEYVMKFELGGAWSGEGNIFLKGSTFNSSARGKIMLNTLIADLMNKHSYRPAFSSDLSRYNDRCTIYFEKIREESEFPTRAEIACLTLSGYEKLQLTCQKQHLDQLLPSLEAISREHRSKGWKLKEPTKFENEWIVAELDLNWNCWGHSASSEGKIVGRLLVSRLLFHFGRNFGWNFIFNANIKDTADYIWFAKGLEADTIIPNDFIPIAGFDVPRGSDAYAIMLSQNDRLRLLNFPQDMNNLVQQAVSDFGWKIQKITPEKHDVKQCFEIKLNGYPWWTSGKEGVRSRMLIMEIFAKLLEHGYRVRTALDVSRKVNDKSTIVFSRSNPVSNVKRLIVSPTDIDHLRMIGDVGPEERQVFEHAVKNIWPGGVKKYTDQDHEIQNNAKGSTVLFADMHGHPWRSWFVNEALHGRHLMMYIQTRLKQLGWTLLCSADVSAKCHRDKDNDFSLDCHTWYFIKQPSDIPIISPDQSYAPIEPPSYFSVFGFN